MHNFLITYSPFKEYGFQNFYYSLQENSISIDEIEHYESCAVVIPYNYKNIIEPTCFQQHTPYQIPIILPIQAKKSFSNLKDLEDTLLKDNVQSVDPDKVIYTQVSYEEYLEKFEKIQEYLRMGDIYEINYCIPFVFKNIQIPIYRVFFDLVEKMQAPFTALFKYHHRYILSFSPERFLKKENHIIYTEPVKGTAPRGNTQKEDMENKIKLHNNIKERTENVMIVDVCRNDLSKIAQKGTVNVDELYSIKTYATVHQMVSKISCVVNHQVSFKDIIHATFPMASMTGAPKIRAMQIADELENLPRSFYSGTLGVYENTNFDLSVLIRSIFYDELEQELRIWAGSAITIYADPHKEYKECYLKAEKIVQTLKKYLFL